MKNNKRQLNFDNTNFLDFFYVKKKMNQLIWKYKRLQSKPQLLALLFKRAQRLISFHIRTIIIMFLFFAYSAFIWADSDSTVDYKKEPINFSHQLVDINNKELFTFSQHMIENILLIIQTPTLHVSLDKNIVAAELNLNSIKKAPDKYSEKNFHSAQETEIKLGQRLDEKKSILASEDLKEKTHNIEYLIDSQMNSKNDLTNLKESENISTSLSSNLKSNESLKQKEIIQIEEGVNHLIPIAVNHLNRFITPFKNPQVKTSSTVPIEVDGPVIYVLTEQAGPISLFISEKDDPLYAMSLTLISKRIPPREVTLISNFNRDKITQELMSTLYDFEDSFKQNHREHMSSRTNEIKEIMRSIFNKKIPNGFKVNNNVSSKILPKCEQKDVHIDFSKGLVLENENKLVFIGPISIRGNSSVHLNYDGCQYSKLMALAFYPKTYLEKKEQTLAILIAEK
ncbi:hypothetical protein [Thorsellia kenyensis]|uniref:Chalcone isomerase domain-containing protein n=1 Tax=Thorsellia kenyensis TaxID=1549888 RepID=A0ABV6CDA3_9GAMM